MVGFIAPLTVVTLVVVVIRRSAAASGRTAGVMPTSTSVRSLLPLICSFARGVTRRLTFNGGYRSAVDQVIQPNDGCRPGGDSGNRQLPSIRKASNATNREAGFNT